MPMRYAYWVSVSTFILTTPLPMAVLISSFMDKEPPWNTRYLSIFESPTRAPMRLPLTKVSSQFPATAWSHIPDLLQQVQMELNIPRLVNTVYVSKCGHNTKVGTDQVQCGVDIPHIGRLSVQRSVIHACVVHTVFFTAGDADFHLEPYPKQRHALEVLGTDFNVFMLGLLGQVKHVRGEEGFTVLLEVLFVGLEHAVKPQAKLLGTVVAVQDNWTVETDQST